MNNPLHLWNTVAQQLSVKNMLLYHQERNRELMKRSYELAAELYVLSIALDEVQYSQGYLELPCKKCIITAVYDKIPNPWHDIRNINQEYIDSSKRFYRAFKSLLLDSVIDADHRIAIEFYLEKLRVYIGLMERWYSVV